MSYQRKLKGLYVITDDNLTPSNEVLEKVALALQGGAGIVQLRDKISSDDILEQIAREIQKLCRKYDALFVLNDNIKVAIKMESDGLHIGRSDHENFIQIRKEFQGIIGVSCYGDVSLAKKFESMGADYVAFGSFYHSPTKPTSNIVPLETLQQAKEKLTIPICAIGGISLQNVDEIMQFQPEMVSVISDIWKSDNIIDRCDIYTKKFKG